MSTEPPPLTRGASIAILALRTVGALALAAFLLGALSPLARMLNEWMAAVPRLEPAQAIVVVARGGADADGVLTNRSLRRALLGIDLHRRGLAPLLVFTGSRPEVQARVHLARGLGVPEGAILPVPGPLTTRDEAARLAGLLLPREVRRILLVADPIDMPRTRGVFERRGFSVLPAPTAAGGPGDPESRLGLLRDLCIELAGLLYYRLTGAL